MVPDQPQRSGDLDLPTPVSLPAPLRLPIIAAISGTCLAGAFEFALSCDLRIAEDGDYLIGLGTLDERVLILVDIDKLMSSEEMGLIEKMAA